MFERARKDYPLLRYPWQQARASLLALSQTEAECVQITYTNPQTGAHVQNILGYYALMLRPGQTLRLPARSPACVFHVIEGGMRADIDSATFTLGEADTCCAPGYTAVTLTNTHNVPTFVFMADETPLHQKLGVYENRG